MTTLELPGHRDWPDGVDSGGVASPPRPSATRPRRSGPRRRAAGGVVLLPPWRRAPLLALREPAVILAVLGAAAILACASSSAALFLSSASSESLRRIAAANCPDATYPAVEVPAGGVVSASQDGQVRRALAGAGLPEPDRMIQSVGTVSAFRGATNKLVTLFYRPDVVQHVTVLARGPARGVWLPSVVAAQLGVRAGGTVTFGGATGTALPVAGVYRDRWRDPVQPYWCSSVGLFQNFSYGGDTAPPPLALASDPDSYAAVQQATGLRATQTWVSRVDTSNLTLAEARDLNSRQAAAYRAAGLAPPADLASRNNGPGQLPVFADEASLIRNGLRGPVVPIALGGTLLALLLVGAAGSYWADRRSREVRLLSSRGVGPVQLAGKAVLELAAPAVAGTLLGWLLARWLVQALGPNSHLDRSAPVQALGTAAVALAAGLGLLAVVAGLRSRGATERPVGARGSWLSAVPWELVLLAGALGCYLRLRSSDAVVLDRNIAQVNLLVVAFPLLFLLGAAVLVVRLLTLLLPAAGRLAGRRSPAWYLAARRITASRAVSVTLLAAASLPIAVGVYAAGLTQTSQYTLDSKAHLFVGSNVAVESVDPLRRTAETDRVGTIVTRYLYAKVGAQDVVVLAVDPDTFQRSAFWDRRLADEPLGSLLDRIRQPGPDGRLTALLTPDAALANDRVGAEYDIRLGATTARLVTVATTRLFPGRRLPDPILVVDARRLGPVDPHAGSLNELWSTGPSTAAQAAVLAQHARVFDTTDLTEVFEAANFLGISWTFGYLTALAGLVGLVAAGGLLLYLETRQRSRVASYALGRRMGLTRGTHLRSLLAELGTMLAAAFAVGTALAWVAILLVYRQIDVDTSRPPPPLLTVPTAAILGTGAAAAVLTLLAALYAQRSADRTDVAEVLRLGS